jgi:hypothetical protein
MSLETANVLDFLQRFAATYEAGEGEFFDNFAKDASFFTPSSPTRVDSLQEYRKGFENQLSSGGKRVSQILSPEVRILGSKAALATYHNRIQVGGASVNVRASILVEGSADDLKITHMHFSPLGAPAVPAAGTSPQTVNVLEERVASAVGAVGTPK